MPQDERATRRVRTSTCLRPEHTHGTLPRRPRAQHEERLFDQGDPFIPELAEASRGRTLTDAHLPDSEAGDDDMSVDMTDLLLPSEYTVLQAHVAQGGPTVTMGSILGGSSVGAIMEVGGPAGARAHAHIHARARMRMHTRVHSCASWRWAAPPAHVRMHTYMHVHICICIHVYMPHVHHGGGRPRQRAV